MWEESNIEKELEQFLLSQIGICVIDQRYANDYLQAMGLYFLSRPQECWALSFPKDGPFSAVDVTEKIVVAENPGTSLLLLCPTLVTPEWNLRLQSYLAIFPDCVEKILRKILQKLCLAHIENEPVLIIRDKPDEPLELTRQIMSYPLMQRAILEERGFNVEVWEEDFTEKEKEGLLKGITRVLEVYQDWHILSIPTFQPVLPRTLSGARDQELWRVMIDSVRPLYCCLSYLYYPEENRVIWFEFQPSDLALDWNPLEKAIFLRSEEFPIFLRRILEEKISWRSWPEGDDLRVELSWGHRRAGEKFDGARYVEWLVEKIRLIFLPSEKLDTKCC